jgi:hypothetical protein
MKKQGKDIVMNADCHIHMVLDGVDWKAAIARHAGGPDISYIRRILAQYQTRGISYLRDGGDRWGVGAAARMLAPEYGIDYKTPLAPLCKAGRYGSFIGETWQNLKEYAELVCKIRSRGGDFIKIMISGLMDFDRFGVLTSTPLTSEEIRQIVHIAHEEGFSVMAHCNGAETAEAAAAAGVESIEHGAYLKQAALAAMAETGTVWVPTLSTVGNLRGKGRFNEAAVCAILDAALQSVADFGAMGGLIAPGTDAGAWAVPHGSETEYPLLQQALGMETDTVLSRGIRVIREKF